MPGLGPGGQAPSGRATAAGKVAADGSADAPVKGHAAAGAVAEAGVLEVAPAPSYGHSEVVFMGTFSFAACGPYCTETTSQWLVPLLYLQTMTSSTIDDPVTCPARYARARRVSGNIGSAPHNCLVPAPPALQGVLAALVGRDTRMVDLTAAQRLSHFPASPLIALSWYHGLDAGLVHDTADGPVWRPFGARVVLSGSQSQPITSWAPTTGRGYMACFTADVAQALFGIELAAIHDRFVPAHAVLDAGWAPLFDALLGAPDDAATMAVLEQHLTARWRAIKGDASPLASVRQLGRHWVERLALKAHAWQRDVSPRHVERKIKSYSGRSLREWQALVRTESLFFAARDRYDAGTPFNWAELALEQGFADQAHMSRAARQITGFPPGEFAQRFIEDESFWMYRLWV